MPLMVCVFDRLRRYAARRGGVASIDPFSALQQERRRSLQPVGFKFAGTVPRVLSVRLPQVLQQPMGLVSGLKLVEPPEALDSFGE